MSNVQKVQNVSIPKVRAADLVVPVWKLVLKRELTDLWIGGKAFNLLLLYSILLGLMLYTYSLSAELSMLPPQEAVYEMLKNSMIFSIFVGLVIGADSISGERDRSTLESLMLTPVNRRHIIIAKLMAGVSPWPAAYLIVLPFLYVLAQGNEVLGPAMFWGAIMGTVLVLGYTGLGMLVSFWSSTNKISYFVSLSIFALHLVPVELTGDGVDIAGIILQWINPVAAVNYFLSKHLVNYRSVAENWPWLVSSILLATVTVGFLLRFVELRLRLEPGLRRKIRGALRKAIGLISIFVLILVSLSVSTAYAFPMDQAQEQNLAISIDSKFKQVEMGDVAEFNTVVTNNGLQTSSPLIVAMNVINLKKTGEAIDPEEWSPERTQYIDPLAPDEAVNLDWMITTRLYGDYMVYLVLIPQPADTDATTFPVASSSLYLTVEPSARLQPSTVLPFALGVPIFLLAITLVVYRRRRQQIDIGDPL
jgi:ABC-type transport system involved in multi-copper enzyme maturation permease subunit